MRGISLKFLPFLCVMCPDVDRGLARQKQLQMAKAPVKTLLPLTATTHNHRQRTNPSGKTDANLIDTLGSTNSSSNNVHLKPFSTSILSFLNWIIATVTKICTKDHSKLAHANSSPSIFTYFYSFKYHLPIIPRRDLLFLCGLQLERYCLGFRFERNRFSGQIY